jgi:protein phosphatase PTC7
MSDCRFFCLIHVERVFFYARQLAKVPSVVKLRDSDAIMDTPDDADIYETKLRDGDLVIAYVG